MRWFPVLPLIFLCALAAVWAQDNLNLPPSLPNLPPVEVDPVSPEQPLTPPEESPEVVIELPPIDVPEPPADGGPFTIGHLRGSDEMPLSPRALERLRTRLAVDGAFMAALYRSGRNRVEIIGTDSHRDLERRMSNTEFDMVFVPALLFIRQQGDYQVLGQLDDPNTVGTGERELYQRSVIFVNSESPLFGLSTAGLASSELEALAARLESQTIAVVSASSAVGYVFPLLTLRERYGLHAPPTAVYCDSAEEVVLAVLNNLHTMGACDEATFQRVAAEFTQGLEADAIIRALPDPHLVPAPPIVVRSELHPERSPLGRELSRALAEFFESREDFPLVMVRATDRPFRRLQSSVEEFDRWRMRP